MPTVPAPRPLAILAVEDHPAYISVLRRVRARQGILYTLQVIAAGQDALDFFDHLAQHEHLPCPDLLLLDLRLPRQHGTTLLQRCRAIPRCAGIPVIIVTASVELTDRTATLALGAKAFFQKPVSVAASMELGHLIDTFTRGGAPRAERAPPPARRPGMASGPLLHQKERQ